MAQKLGLALVALLGLANAQIAVARGGVVTLLPAASHSGLRHDDDSEGPKLGHEVVLGHPVKLGEEDSRDGHDDHDEGHGFGILNFANAVRHGDDDHRPNRRREDNSGQNDKHDDRPKRSDSNKGRRDNQRKASSDKSDRKASQGKGEKSNNSKDNKVTLNVKVIKVEAKQDDDHREAKKEKKEERSEGHREERKEDRSEGRREERTDGHHEADADDVVVPVFGKLRYVDTDTSGEATKAPITIVTAPLISTAETDRHKVGINQVVGKSNCPECKEENHEARETVKSANKALSKDVDKLSTTIKGPIDNVVVKAEHRKEEKSHSEDDDCDERREGYDRHGGAIIDQRRLKKQLAVGEARENAPFVVGAVKFTKNLSTEDDDDEHHREHDSRHEEHEDHDEHDDHRRKDSKRHD